MFHTNQFITNKYDAFPYDKTVIENRAPTDDSIRLFDEYLQKARASLIKDVHMKSSVLEYRAGLFECPHKLYSMFINYVVILNGILINGEVEVPSDNEMSVESIHSHVIEALSENITKNLMRSIKSEFDTRVFE